MPTDDSKNEPAWIRLGEGTLTEVWSDGEFVGVIDWDLAYFCEHFQ
jgi:hypothetical protein